ncbi:FAA hydrolase family protein [candidate division KSB3 bacterium]|uniref:FAA hydrolase family protein n=1 Tax=candidate division KSB3 bacterium TaxID=2044937 RepID=A0A9D5Q4V5_9BACT|nr:FAA hydrolase family protein [candidate division KSB3 bacterium]MBD3323311.1 FAA hydrolase family protein [candidate division KSB3 bacterium]
MRLATFLQQDAAHVGAVIHDEYLVDLNVGYVDLLCCQRTTEPPDHSFVPSLKALLEQGESALHTAREIVKLAQEALTDLDTSSSLPAWLVPLKDIRLAAPVPTPQKVIAIGQNYRDHCLEQNAPIPERPIIFAKFPTTIIGPGEQIVWNPALTKEVDYEAELGVVIGKTAKNVAREHALDYVAGYLNANDVSARNLQFSDRQWVRGKSVDTFCPLGPYLVTKEEIPSPNTLPIRAVLSGNVMQESNTEQMIFDVPYLIEFMTTAFTLLPGDIILTGTPPGVGVFRDPKVFLAPGDTITIEIEGLGALTNPVGTWSV